MAGFSILGKITKRILSGEIPNDYVMKKTTRREAPPKSSSIRHGSGHGLGKGAHRKRNGGSGGANDG